MRTTNPDIPYDYRRFQGAWKPVKIKNLTRTREACERCRRKRAKCDGKEPCQRCRRVDTEWVVLLPKYAAAITEDEASAVNVLRDVSP
ncbi:hypothetical protein BC938DRAFT_476951 [Jimgerdemannia flammicorona]|uniref:Zn(2)-C6 fungal-type domain-containing protein n=1 Tax=Jimgerdemannia flammicorona TaxID=994334 RepID=A0A433QPX5_9FUNG|nr:hypothetical protein BC938DRAFT_476951 [Jimgerdemannia flammicorona]